jgi:hypothetical protein
MLSGCCAWAKSCGCAVEFGQHAFPPFEILRLLLEARSRDFLEYAAAQGRVAAASSQVSQSFYRFGSHAEEIIMAQCGQQRLDGPAVPYSTERRDRIGTHQSVGIRKRLDE